MTTTTQQPPQSTGQVAASLGVPVWKVRRAIDALEPTLGRVGQNRAVPPEMIPKLAYVLGATLPKRA